MYSNRVKQALAEGKLQLGTSFAQLPSPEIARILAAAGFDWAFIDTEHGWFGIETVREVCYASVRAGLCPIVRVVGLEYGLIARALDCGAQGVMFPRVESVELLERAVSWTKFPPVGVRGCGLNAAHVDYAKASIAEVVEHANANTMVVLQIETRRALEMRDELLSVKGIDAVMVGPVDLSISLGVPASHYGRGDGADSRFVYCPRHRAWDADAHAGAGEVLAGARHAIPRVFERGGDAAGESERDRGFATIELSVRANGEVAESADAADSKSAGVTPREGSSPSFPTIGSGGRSGDL
jgi:2-keto-3-deoxy-L-rhamnonate aldolase RhmA